LAVAALSCVLLLTLFSNARASGDDGSRQPKLFYVSSSTSTTTISTHTICFHILSTKNNKQIGVTCGRKKRSMTRRKKRMVTSGSTMDAIAPSRSEMAGEEAEHAGTDIESSDAARDAKYLNYWMTTTTTQTEYSYTSTHKLASLLCYPLKGFTYLSCPDVTG